MVKKCIFIAICFVLLAFVTNVGGQNKQAERESVNTPRASASPESMTAHKFDDYAAINCESEMARLDNYAVNLQAEPGTQGYVIVYGGRRDTRRNEVKARLTRVKLYLVKNRSINASRIVALDGGFRDKFTVELWLKGSGVQAPAATPTVQPRNVRFRKGRVRKWEYHCSELG